MAQPTTSNINRIDHIKDTTTVCTVMQSEMHQNYQNPILKKPPVTRANRLEKFLWHEFYDEYIRSKQRLEAMRPPNPVTEYVDEYSRSQLLEDGKELDIAGEELVNRFPVYSTPAISVWNPTGEPTCNFRYHRSITIPTTNQHGQWDD